MKLTAFFVYVSLLGLALTLFGGLVILVDSLANASAAPASAEASPRWIDLQTVATTPTSTSTSTRTPTWTSTAVSTDTATPTTTSTATSTNTPTQTSTATATPIPPPAICVLVFDDLDEDGLRGVGEGLLAGALITVTDESEMLIGTHTTDGVLEPFCFTSLPVGLYFIREQNPPGYVSTTSDTEGRLLSSATVAQVEFGDRLGGTPTVTSTPTESPTTTSTATQTHTATATGTATATATSTPPATATSTASNTPTVTTTPTESPTATETGTPTSTPSPTSTGSATATATHTTTATFTPTTLATGTATTTFTPTTLATGTATATATATPSHTPTITPAPTDTATPTITRTPGPIGAVRVYLPFVPRLKFIPPPPPTATPTPTVSCSEVIVNGGFEEDEAWIFGNTPRPGRYTSEEVYLGHRSAILGIQPPQSDAYSWSSVRQQVTIPADADVASLSFWYKPFTEEPPVLNWQMVDGGWPIADGEWPMADGRWWIVDGEWQMGHRLSDIGYRPPVVGYSDRQEALILEEQFPNPAVLGILMRLRSNSQAWSRQTHDLTAYAGQTINVYFNAFNNGQGGLRTWMYLDEVSLKICINVPQ